MLKQLYLIIINKNSNRMTIIYSLAVSAIIFALSHIPNRILIYTPDNLVLDAVGLLFGSKDISSTNSVYASHERPRLEEIPQTNYYP